MIFSLLLFAQTGSVQFAASALPCTVFVRQQISYAASMRMNALSRLRFLVAPAYTPPDIQGAEVYTFPLDTIRRIQNVAVNGSTFKQYIYLSAVFPLKAGTDTIPPSTLTYTLLNEADPYISQSTTVHSAPQRFVVLPLPVQGRPSDFSGAVGRFTIAAVADSQGLRTGNGFVVRATLTGTGNIPMLQRPALTIPWAMVVNTSDSVMWSSTDALMHGFKEFRWLVTPRSAGRLIIPPVRYSYFDPATKTYGTSATSAISLTIADGSVTSSTDTFSVAPFQTLMRTLRQHLLLVLGGLLLAGVIARVIALRYRIDI